MRVFLPKIVCACILFKIVCACMGDISFFFTTGIHFWKFLLQQEFFFAGLYFFFFPRMCACVWERYNFVPPKYFCRDLLQTRDIWFVCIWMRFILFLAPKYFCRDLLQTRHLIGNICCRYFEECMCVYEWDFFYFLRQSIFAGLYCRRDILLEIYAADISKNVCVYMREINLIFAPKYFFEPGTVQRRLNVGRALLQARPEILDYLNHLVLF